MLSAMGRGGVTVVPLNISIRRDISSKARDTSIKQVGDLCTQKQNLEFIPVSGTVHCELPVARLNELAALPEVEWIDIEKEVPIEQLLD
jgi:hypothetical protein